MTTDITFDFRTDTPNYPRCDPDTRSPTLRRYQCLLWSKPLPSGPLFDLSERGYYLYSALGTFELSSDTVIQNFTHWPSMKPIIDQLSEQEHEEFRTIGGSIGGRMIWPAERIDRKPTINVARAFNRKIADRLDLTLECLRRHYLGDDSPLAQVLARYAYFFELFGDFRGFVEVFLLDDLVTNDGGVKFFMPFDNFHPPARRFRKTWRRIWSSAAVRSRSSKLRTTGSRRGPRRIRAPAHNWRSPPEEETCTSD